MYEDVTYEEILKRMLDRVPSDVDKREGSIVYDALAPAAVEIQLMYTELHAVLNEASIRAWLASERGHICSTKR